MKSAIVLLFFVVLCGCTLKEKSEIESPTQISFEYFDNRIVVPVKINNQGPFYMIFDTGGSNMLMPEAAHRLSLETHNAGLGGGAGDNQIPMQKTLVKSWSIADIELKDQEFFIMDLSPIKKAFGFEKFDGIIGFELLQDYVVTINYDELKLTFTTFEKFKSSGESVSFRLYGDKPVLESKINGIATEVLIDTGDRSSFTLFKKFNRQNSMGHFFKKEKVISGVGAGGPIPARLGVVPEIRFGKDQIVARQVAARLPLTSKGFFAQSDLGGSVGNGLLQNYVVSFNYRDKVMSLEPGKKKRGPYQFIPPSKLN